MKQTLDHYLNLLKEYDPLTEEQHAAIAARVRREVIARYGGFVVQLRPTVHTEAPDGRGMLVFFRPALAFAAIAAIAVGVTVAVQRSGWWSQQAPVLLDAPRLTSPTEIIASAGPIVPGSGVAVSVFGAPQDLPSAAPSAQPTPKRIQRAGGRRLNPAAGVFSSWGESVFSEDEILQSGREGKNVFQS
ncbi:hypothetical protein HY634_02805 [Candidatus Uhrbacteria bacterium]|nr:hypothetical protein [Candidatus Uhrbacteria bacterium]